MCCPNEDDGGIALCPEGVGRLSDCVFDRRVDDNVGANEGAGRAAAAAAAAAVAENLAAVNLSPALVTTAAAAAAPVRIVVRIHARSHFLGAHTPIHQIMKEAIIKSTLQSCDDGSGRLAEGGIQWEVRVRGARHGLVRSDSVSSIGADSPLCPSLPRAQPHKEEKGGGKEAKVEGVTETGGVDQGGEAQEREGWWHICLKEEEMGRGCLGGCRAR